MKNSLIFILTVFATIGSANVYGQITLSGVVYAEDSDLPIAGVEIYDEFSNQLVQTNGDGMFQFNDLKEGQHALTTFSLEYESVLVSLDLVQDLSLIHI